VHVNYSISGWVGASNNDPAQGLHTIKSGPGHNLYDAAAAFSFVHTGCLAASIDGTDRQAEGRTPGRWVTIDPAPHNTKRNNKVHVTVDRVAIFCICCDHCQRV